METRLLKIFRAVARHSGLAGAATELHLTPSALSHALKALEMEVGCRLFERVGRRLVINQAGEHLLAGIAEPLAAIERTAQSLQELRRWGQGRLRLGVAPTIAAFLLPRVLKELQAQFPRLDLLIETGDMAQLVALLREERIDLAFGVEGTNAADMESRPLLEDELLFCVSPHHAWSDGRPLSKTEVRRQTLLVDRRSSATFRLIHQHLQEQQAEPGQIVEVADVDTIKEMVQLGLGVTILAPWGAGWELARGRLKARPLGSRPLHRKWVMLLKTKRRLSLVEEKFCTLCRRHAGAMPRDRKDLPRAGSITLR